MKVTAGAKSVSIELNYTEAWELEEAVRDNPRVTPQRLRGILNQERTAGLARKRAACRDFTPDAEDIDTCGRCGEGRDYHEIREEP